ncbi:deoxyuridine 5'-triphosphate nucleotidohydrolase [Cnuella takakiae]|uniref:Deoxyuridine 5'-triphosphate nucleotidohydrolase n=1 Tax=Cnuella takakiae TaxID=1302690 RepID=A0A1M5J5N1_9BACT|nr:dUTP diphosphatase [Cnuella takakiae]SHG35821.1 deoxyuridine 5'-triphosphate nucleotidohydrolase [Cnuella takakiae]
MPLEVKIINRSNNPLPQYATAGASGMDLRASLAAPITLGTLERAMIPTGIFIELPEGYEAQVRARSGMAIRQGIACVNAPGTIDADYRGEIHAILVNLSAEPQTIHPGDRVAQLVVQQVEKVVWQPVDSLAISQRNDGGFGSTGKN